jgi:hypothetical protein
MKIFKNNYIYLFALIFSVIIISCEKDSEVEDVELSRMFRPVDFEALVDSNHVSFYWTDIADASYVVEVSEDSLLFTNSLQQFSVADSSLLYLSDLLNETLYSARVKSVSSVAGIADSEWQEVFFETE